MVQPGWQTRFSRTALLVLLTAVATACTRVPEIEDRLTPDLRGADYPALMPLEQSVPPLPAPEEESLRLERQLDARSARLKARAEALRRAQF